MAIGSDVRVGVAINGRFMVLGAMKAVADEARRGRRRAV